MFLPTNKESNNWVAEQVEQRYEKRLLVLAPDRMVVRAYIVHVPAGQCIYIRL